MWRKEGEEYRCPWRHWEECLKRECPFYDEMVLCDIRKSPPERDEESQRVHRCLRVLSEAKPKPMFYYKGE